MAFKLDGKRIWVAGHNGMVGSAVVRRLAYQPCEILTVGRAALDLRDASATRAWMRDARPDVVILAAAKVGGIAANDASPADFLYDNLCIQNSVIGAAAIGAVQKLLFLGSSCIYPKISTQPIPESELLNGPLEPTNQWYAVAKIAGLKLAEAYRIQGGHDFISAMPTNLYGPGDNYDLDTSHVIPALLRKAYGAEATGAPEMTVWGSGTPRREFLHVDDLADAIIHLLKVYSAPGHVNIGFGQDIMIADLAAMIADIAGFAGRLRFDASRPDGTPRKLLDTGLLAGLGWKPRIELRKGLESVYALKYGERSGRALPAGAASA